MSDLLFAAETRQRDIARELYALVRDLPLISPHGHVDPDILADDAPFGDPAHLIVVPDHYLTRMLQSQGVPLARLGVPVAPGNPSRPTDGRSGGCSPRTGACSGAPRHGCGWSARSPPCSGWTRR
jgi:glucuronate isomerase